MPSKKRTVLTFNNYLGKNRLEMELILGRSLNKAFFPRGMTSLVGDSGTVLTFRDKKHFRNKRRPYIQAIKGLSSVCRRTSKKKAKVAEPTEWTTEWTRVAGSVFGIPTTNSTAGNAPVQQAQLAPSQPQPPVTLNATREEEQMRYMRRMQEMAEIHGRATRTSLGSNLPRFRRPPRP